MLSTVILVEWAGISRRGTSPAETYAFRIMAWHTTIQRNVWLSLSTLPGLEREGGAEATPPAVQSAGGGDGIDTDDISIECWYMQ